MTEVIAVAIYIIVGTVVSALVYILAPIGYKLGILSGMTSEMLQEMFCWLIGVFWPISIPVIIVGMMLYIAIVRPIMKLGNKVERRFDEYLNDKKAKDTLKSKVDCV